MKKPPKRLINLALITFFIALLNSCATTGRLNTQEIRADAISGKFALILYGARFGDDLENVAILDFENDEYKFEVFAPDFDYTIKHSVSAREAVQMAERFISFHSSFKKTQVSSIIDNKGKIIGYEFRPLYSPSEFGMFNVLEIDYLLSDGIVTVKIDLVPEIKYRRFFDKPNNGDSH